MSPLRVPRFPRARLRPLVTAGVALVLAHAPPVAAALPVLGLLRGPLGVVLAVLACAAAALGGGDRLGPLLRRRVPPLALFVAGFALHSAAGLHYTGRLRVSGDEPHYLLMAQSLWRDGDLELRDNKARGEMEEYTPADIEPHWGAPRADGRPFPAHGVGLPALLAPVYALGGRRACVLLLSAMGSGLALAARALAARLGTGYAAAQLAWAATIGPPAAFYAFHVYTEVPSALALAGALLLLLASPRSVALAAAAAVLASSLPWLHLKLLPAAAALGLVALVRLRGRALAAFVTVAALAAASYLGFFERVYGSPWPLATYGGTFPTGMEGAPLRAAAGLFLDRSYGLLPHAPVFLLALAAVPLALRRPLRETWPLALLAVAVLVPALGWRMWWGGQCPPGRFLVPLVPLLGALVAVRAARDEGPPRGLLRWRGALLAAGFALLAFAVADPGRLLLLNRGSRPTRLWAALSGEVEVGRYLPSLTHADAAEARVALLWAVAIGLLLTLDLVSRGRPWADRLFGGLALPLVLLVLLGTGVDRWARRGSTPGGESTGLAPGVAVPTGAARVSATRVGAGAAGRGVRVEGTRLHIGQHPDRHKLCHLAPPSSWTRRPGGRPGSSPGAMDAPFRRPRAARSSASATPRSACPGSGGGGESRRS